MPLSPGQVIHNRYRIVALLGQGGMGAVYRAWDLNLNRPVALKENLDVGISSQKQFEREAVILANLSHPNLPHVSDYFSIPGQGQYLVMEFVEGEDLQSILERQGFLPEELVLGWIIQVCEALEYLHSQPSPVIHRDIKPANIKIRPDGRAMLVDFGIAKIFDPHTSTTVGAKAVTPGFSPPEQYGGHTDARSDLYSLGATLYTLLTGKVLPDSVLRAAAQGSITPPSHFNPSVHPTTEQAVLKAIDIATDRRFQRAGDLRAALLQASAPAAAAKPTPRTQVAPTALVGQTRAVQQPASRTGMSVPARKPTPASHWMLVGIGCATLLGVAVIAVIMGRFLGYFDNTSGGAAQPRTTMVAKAPAVQMTATSTTIKPPTATLLQPTSRPPTKAAPKPTSLPPTARPNPTNPPPAQPPRLILDQGYNCRGGPAGSYELIWTFEANSELQLIGRSNNGWWLVRIDDSRTRRKQCWVSGGQPQGDLTQVPYSDWTGTVDTAKTPWP